MCRKKSDKIKKLLVCSLININPCFAIISNNNQLIPILIPELISQQVFQRDKKILFSCVANILFFPINLEKYEEKKKQPQTRFEVGVCACVGVMYQIDHKK
jgi:hypothetical protein